MDLDHFIITPFKRSFYNELKIVIIIVIPSATVTLIVFS